MTELTPSQTPETNEKKLPQLRDFFPVFGTCALIFAIGFTLCFYRARVGISYPVFVLLAILLIQKIAVSLLSLNILPAGTDGEKAVPAKKHCRAGIPYYIASMLIAFSNALTSSTYLHVLSSVAVLLLLEAGFLDVVLQSSGISRDFKRRLTELFLLPLAAIGNLIRALTDSCSFFKKTRLFRNEKSGQILLGLLAAVPVLITAVLLLSSADMVFSTLTETAFDFVFRSSDPFLILLQVLVLFSVCYGIICGTVYLSRQQAELAAKNLPKAPAKPVTAITVCLPLTLIYLLFSVIQIVFLFIGRGSLPAGYTYAEYAHQGFFQLLAVTFLNILLLLICLKPAAGSPVLRIVLTVMSVCTYIMIASAAMRMLLYISAYGLSVLRILVLWFLVLNTFIISGVVVSIYRSRFPLFRYFLAVTAVCYIVLAYARPDYLVASYNLQAETELSDMDLYYLSDRSADAAPLLIPFFSGYAADTPEHSYHLQDYITNLAAECDGNTLRSFNFSRQKALSLLEEYGFSTDYPGSGAIKVTNYSSAPLYSVSVSGSKNTECAQNADYSQLVYGDCLYFAPTADPYDTHFCFCAYDESGVCLADALFPIETLSEDGRTVVLLDNKDGSGYSFKLSRE